MTVEYVEGSAPESVPAGPYTAVFKDLEATEGGKFGPGYRWSFELEGVTDADGKPFTITTLTSQKVSDQTRAGNFVASMRGGRPVSLHEQVAIKPFVGQRFRLLVAIKPNGWNQIEAIGQVPRDLKLTAPMPAAKQVALLDDPDEPPTPDEPDELPEL